MSVLDDLRKLSSAEDFFETLGVDFDPAVVHVARLHILRRMGQYLATTDLSGLSDEDIRAACGRHLAQAYNDFVASTPIEQRLFKVHQDAVKPKEPAPKPFVPMSALTLDNGSDTGTAK